MKRYLKLLQIINLGVLLSFVFTGCSSEKKEAQAPPRTIPVVVVTAVQKNVPVQIRAIGNVKAYSTVSIKSMVGGEIVKVFFSEGQFKQRD